MSLITRDSTPVHQMALTLHARLAGCFPILFKPFCLQRLCNIIQNQLLTLKETLIKPEYFGVRCYKTRYNII